MPELLPAVWTPPNTGGSFLSVSREAGADGWESRSANSCFVGRRLRSRPVVTIVAGSVAYRQRAFSMGAVA